MNMNTEKRSYFSIVAGIIILLYAGVTFFYARQTVYASSATLLLLSDGVLSHELPFITKIALLRFGYPILYMLSALALFFQHRLPVPQLAFGQVIMMATVLLMLLQMLGIMWPFFI